MPVYNVADVVADTLRSALGQQYAEIEYIIVDDCTPDNSIEIINGVLAESQYAGKRVRIVAMSRNGGLSAARNRGVREAAGEYIYFLDSDDIITPDCISTHVEAVVAADADFSDANISIIGKKHQYFTPYTRPESLCGSEVLAKYFGGLHVSACNKLIRRSLLLDAGIEFERGMLYEDNLWCYQLCVAARSCVLIPAATYKYLIRGGSITNKVSCEHSRRQFDSFERLLGKMADEFDATATPQLSPLQARWFSRWLLVVKGRLMMSPLPAAERREIARRLKRFNPRCSAPLRWLHAIPYPLFHACFSIPHAIFRLTRR